MTDHLARIRETVSTTRAAQGLPPVTVDDLTLGRVAELLRVSTKKAGMSPPTRRSPGVGPGIASLATARQFDRSQRSGAGTFQGGPL